MKILIAIYIFCLTPVYADKPAAADLEQVQKISQSLSPLPELHQEFGTRRHYRSIMDDLVRDLHAIARPEQRSHKVHKNYLLKPTRLVPRLEAQAALYEALQRDLSWLGDDVESFSRRRGFLDRRPFPLVMDLRLELAELMHRSYYLPRLYIEQFDAALNGPIKDSAELFGFGYYKVIERGGMLSLLKHSRRARSLVSGVSSYFNDELNDFDQSMIQLVERLVLVDPSEDAAALELDLVELKSRFEIFENRLQYMVKNVYEIIAPLIYQKNEPAREFADVAKAVEALGRGLKFSAQRAEELRPSFLSVNTSQMHSYARHNPEDGTVLMDIHRELYLLFAGGGNHFTQHALPPSLRGEDGRDAIKFFHRALIFHYVLAVGVEVERLTKTRLSLPTLTSRLLPAVRREQTSLVEDKLWSIFFAASGLSEQNVCQLLLE